MNLRELIAAKEELEAKIEEARARETAQVVQEIKEKMATYGITAQDLRDGVQNTAGDADLTT